VNGLILFGGERLRRRGAEAEIRQQAEDQAMAAERQKAAVAAGMYGPVSGGRHASGQRALRQQEATLAVEADRRVTALGYLQGTFLGAMQILALLPGISRDGIVMVSGMFRGLSRQDAARFSFLLSAPVIFAAGMLKIGDLTGPLGNGIRGQVIFGSVLCGIGAYVALRSLVRYLSDASRTLTPFAIYCLLAGVGCAIYLSVR
jgi:undecaprenyl-diphosphatase